MLTMSFVHFNIWQIKRTESKNLAMGRMGFGRDIEKSLLEATSPFVFSTVNERSILRFLKLIACDNGKIGTYAKRVDDRNESAHPKGNIFFSGAKRAAYEEVVLGNLSRRLMAEFGRGFDVTNLRKMWQFYRMFEIRDAVRLESGKMKRDAPRLVSSVEPIRHTVGDELSWNHYRLLMQVESPAAREWYMNEATDQHWSSRQLDRQISALYYERLLASRKKVPVLKEAREKLAPSRRSSSSATRTCSDSST